MCGISGILNFNREHPVSRSQLMRSTDLIAHRGPDDAGHYLSGPIGLGHRRLSILDVSEAGHQPMPNEDETVWIVYNGETYNFAEFLPWLRGRGHRFRSSSDTEVLIHLYEELGPAFVERLQGMFAFALWDAKRERLLLARDRLGIKPLYYWHDEQTLVFASELKALLAHPRVPIDLDPSAISEFVHLMSIPGPRAVFRGVRRLQAGHLLIVENGRVEERQYWEVPVGEAREQLCEDDATAEFTSLFRKTVSSHMVADVPVGAFLSGGVDSSAVVAMAAPETAHPLQTFSITFTGLAEYDESRFARAVASHTGANHEEFNLTPHLVEALPQVAWHADEPFAISSSFALYFLSQLARERVKVVLTGDGGDEVFAGYPWRHVHFPEKRELSIPPRARRMLRQLVGTGGAEVATSSRSLDRLRRALAPDERYVQSFQAYQHSEVQDLVTRDRWPEIDQAWRQNAAQRAYDRFPTASQLARKLYTDLKTTLVSEMLTKVDRMTMAFGLEARVPFLDHRLVEWATSVPGRYKIQGTEGKRIVKKAMEPFLPHDVLYRPKQGFNVPMKLWMRDQLRDYVRDTLTDDRIRSRGLFEPAAVREVIRSHEAGERDGSNRIFIILMTELWFQQFIDRRSQLAAHD